MKAASLLLKPWLLFGLSGLLLTACDKEAAAPPCDCPELKLEPNYQGFYPTRGPRMVYATPSFNPEKPREVAFLKFDSQDPAVAGLWKMNLDTRQQTRVRAGRDMYLQVRWGAGGWLALSKDDQIWKVKSSGDSLTRLTSGVAHYQPQWRPDGRQLVCWRDGSTAAEQGLVFLSSKGGPTTAPLALERRGYAEAWSPDGQKLLMHYGEGKLYGMGIYYPATGKAELIAGHDPSVRALSIGGAA